MKKNVMMRLASFLLVAVLISTSAISGTYAKYVTEGQSTDSARVAKFGVTVVGTATIFSDSYKDVATTYTNPETGDAITVQADTQGTKVVAPGVEGTLTDFVVTGKPEVDVAVTYKADLNIGTNWMIDGTNKAVNDEGWTANTFYCPIIITINGTSYDGSTYQNAAAFENAVEKAIEACAQTYEANTDLSTTVADDLNVTWNWPFEVNATKDKWDTQLGDVAAKNVANAGNIALTIDCTITQVD